jgi:hypothetical protein
MQLSEFRHHTFNRAIELSKVIQNITNGEVYQGPFKGMKISPDYIWGDGDISSKLLGLYEHQLHESIYDIININPDILLNIGCAEGYYGVGVAQKTNCPAVLIDVDNNYESIVNNAIQSNNIQNAIFTTNSTIENYKKYLTNKIQPVIIMDCEGAEIQLLNLETFPELKNCYILVETHDFSVENATLTITNRFTNTHNIQIIHSSPKNLNIDIIRNFSDLDKMVLWNEWRPCEMTWLYMKPKQKL